MNLAVLTTIPTRPLSSTSLAVQRKEGGSFKIVHQTFFKLRKSVYLLRDDYFISNEPKESVT